MRNKTFNVKEIIANGLIVFFTVVLLIISMAFISSVSETRYVYKTNPNSFYYDVKGERYSNMYDSMMDNLNAGETEQKNAEFTPYYATARYYEETLRYKVYLEKGRTDKISKSEANRANYRQNMGEIEFIADDIDELYGLKY